MDSTFPRRFDYEQLTELPGIASVPHFYFPGASLDGGADGVLVMIRPATGAPWIGTFAFGHNQGRAATRVLTTPNPEVICVVADGVGYLVRADAPQDWQTVRADPVLDVRQLPGRSLLVFADFTDLVAYGASGIAWAVRIGADDLQIVEASAERIEGTWWNPATAGTVGFVVDPSNGELIGGERWDPQPPGPREPPWPLYAVALLLAAPAGYLAPWPWHTGPTFLGAGLAAGGAAFGVFGRETLVEAIVLAVVLGGLFALVPKAPFITGIVLPAVAGLVVGKLAVGVWRGLRD